MIYIWRRAWPFFSLLTALLLLRAAGDHRSNFHYTGDTSSEQALVTAAGNFQRFGYVATRFTPIQQQLPKYAAVDLRSPGLYYTHYGPLPYLFFSLPFNFTTHGEIGARILAILISMLGLWCALASLYEWTEVFVPSRAVPVLCPLVILALNPVILCFADTLYEQSITEALKWVAFLWAVRSMRRTAEKPASLAPGILASSLLIFTSFDWFIPMTAVLLFVVWTTRGNPIRSARSWVVATMFGCLLPLCLRFAQVAWVFGGVSPALHDWQNIMHARSAGDVEYLYSTARHAAKLLFGILWFAGPVVLLAVLVSFRRLAEVMADGNQRSAIARRSSYLLGLWGAGSISWQFLMRQHSMVHGFTYIPPANFLIWAAAPGLIVLWCAGRTTLAATLAAAQIFVGGMLAKSEIIIPFLRSRVVAEASLLCPSQAEAVLAEAKSMHSSMASEILNTLSATSPTAPCSRAGRRAALWLRLFMYVVKSSSVTGPMPG